MRKSWKWINAYEKARYNNKYSVAKSKEIADRTIKRMPVKRNTNPYSRLTRGFRFKL